MPDDKSASGITSHMPLLLAILIGASIWTYTYTSWFPIFGSILGFGGVLMVVPAMQGLMAAERRQAYARFVDQILFQNPRSAWVYVIILFTGLIAGFFCVQPLRLTNYLQSSSLEVRVGFSQEASEKPPTRRIRINAGDTHSTPLLQPFLGGVSYVWVSAPGLPQIRKKVSGFGWPSMALPEDLWEQPIVLLRPSPSLLVRLRESRPKFTVTVERQNGSEAKTLECDIQEKYVGEPLWLGGGHNSLAIGSGRLNNWLREFRLATIRREVTGELDTILTTTLRPTCGATAKHLEHLRIGDRLKWDISISYPEISISKGQVEIGQDIVFPHEVRMDHVTEGGS